MKYLIISFVFILLLMPNSVFAIEQVCHGNHCIQIAENIGTINIEGQKLQIGINQGQVNIVGDPKDKTKIKDCEIKLSKLEEQMMQYIATIENQERRNLSDTEKIQYATKYMEQLLKKIEQLNQRIASLDEPDDLSQRIKAAKDNYDVPLIIKLLKEKQQDEEKKVTEAARTAYDLAGFLELTLEYIEAYKNYKKAVQLQENNATYLNEAGLMAYTLGDYKKAVEYHNKAVEINEKTLGKEHPSTATSYNNLGLAYYSKGEYERAIEYYEKALAICEKTLGKEHPSTATSYNNLGLAYYSKGEYERAIEYYEKALAILKRVFPNGHPYIDIVNKSLNIAIGRRG